ncbi:CGNR zinc finger domain-containing protein [Bradyrhizobium sp. Arg237L]|uniref:CGNR zinc finger domain-containing protein n=1 Tax=Bradyrhizobium sp. Arg237L TaxID=3003352 RepID=UPI00249E7DAF|nr:CGNR zinc finger domain-containing protein [Bradyrhizobium sp. Arg237L]MDI4232612.1 CGNR zinc finger domain-containing protein [Bradyrhizobium sp. Arg237L]
MADQRPARIFVADSVGLDFLNTLATPLDIEVEWIGSGEDLILWLLQADLVPPEVVADLRKRAVAGEFDAVATQARKLREWFRRFVKAYKGKPLKPRVLQELEPLNRVLIRDEQFGRIVARETVRKRPTKGDGDQAPVSGLAWSRQRRWRSPDALLLPIAQAMAQLVCEEDFQYVKACEGHRCTLMFVDRTRGRARRWPPKPGRRPSLRLRRRRATAWRPGGHCASTSSVAIQRPSGDQGVTYIAFPCARYWKSL